MSRPILLFLGVYVGLTTLDRTLGYDVAYDVGYGAISLMAIVISVTFLWLWRIRGTPMAMGMAVSWGGCFGLIGYWWVFAQIGRRPTSGAEHDILFAFIALYLAGAVLHLAVISRAYFATRVVFWGTLTGVMAITFGLAYAVG